MYNVEKTARSILESLKVMHETVTDYNRTIEHIRRSDTDKEAIERNVIKEETRRDDYIASTAKQITDASNALLEQETAIDEARRSASASDPRFRSAAHLAEISNALKVIEMMGDKLTAPTLQRIVDPFKAVCDYGTLATLREVASAAAPHLFMAFDSTVDFGREPTENLELARSINNLSRKAIESNDGTTWVLAIEMISKRIDDVFGSSNNG